MKTPFTLLSYNFRCRLHEERLSSVANVYGAIDCDDGNLLVSLQANSFAVVVSHHLGSLLVTFKINDGWNCNCWILHNLWKQQMFVDHNFVPFLNVWAFKVASVAE